MSITRITIYPRRLHVSMQEITSVIVWVILLHHAWILATWTMHKKKDEIYDDTWLCCINCVFYFVNSTYLILSVLNGFVVIKLKADQHRKTNPPKHSTIYGQTCVQYGFSKAITGKGHTITVFLFGFDLTISIHQDVSTKQSEILILRVHSLWVN